jgi:hypothetical protein
MRSSLIWATWRIGASRADGTFEACDTQAGAPKAPLIHRPSSDARERLKSRRSPDLTIQERPEPVCPAGMQKLSHRLALDLADALSRDVELFADLLERMV